MYKLSSKCPYCGGTVSKTSNANLYDREYGNGMCYMCDTCEASVGCYDDGTPLGRLADKELKDLKMQAHAKFDPLWKDGSMKRKDAYKWLANKLRIRVEDCHIGYFGKDALLKVIEITEEVDND
jgi:hypothetical protein